jgi:hypothetical protein
VSAIHKANETLTRHLAKITVGFTTMCQTTRKSRGRFWLVATALFLAVVGPDCALLTGTEPGLKHSSRYKISAPSNWKVKGQDESDYAYSLPSGNIATVNSACERDTQVTLEILTRQLMIGLRSLNFLRKENMVIDGKEGQFSAVRASEQGVPFYLNLFVVTKEDCIFDFTLVSPRPIPSQETEEFQSLLKSFHYGND